MYTPKAFELNDLATIHAAIQRHGLATLVTMTDGGLVATHVPLLLDEKRGQFGTLSGHVSIANSQWRETLRGVEALVIFLGPDAYVSPTWYPARTETGRVVPTWNYAAIHAYGSLDFFQDVERLRDLVTRLTDKHEAGFESPWRPSEAPANFIDSQLKAIVGFEMPITRLEGKRKFNQNRSAEDRRGVIQGLGASNEEKDRQVAALMGVLESERGEE